jgi:RimJ/RimL family protein N-acetyltransferase
MITGERLILRAWERTDLDAFTRWFNDPEVTIYLTTTYPCLSREQEERFYDKMLDDKYHWAIALKSDGTLIGNCALVNVDFAKRAAEVGIVLGEKAYWSQGYGREALRLVQDVAFSGLGLHRLFLRHADFNARGHRCYLAAGFVEEGRLREKDFIKGQWCDEVVMSILEREYWARNKAEKGDTVLGRGGAKGPELAAP